MPDKLRQPGDPAPTLFRPKGALADWLVAKAKTQGIPRATVIANLCLDAMNRETRSASHEVRAKPVTS